MSSKMEKSSIELNTNTDILVECEDVVKFFMADGLKVMALQGIDLQIKAGEMMAIIGKSGSGKSTLLNMIGCLDVPTAGRVTFAGVDTSSMSEKLLEDFRKKTIGFVWQNPLRNLFTYMSVLANVMAPMSYTKLKGAARKKRAMELLERVGMAEYANRLPLSLSGGQQQRVAIAVALANNPKLLLADEPTGAVDRANSAQIMSLFSSLSKEGVTIVIVTHDTSLAASVDRVVEISDGKISTEMVRREEAAFSETVDNHDLFSVLDRASRVKLSDEVKEIAGITGNRVRIEAEDGRIIITSE